MKSRSRKAQGFTLVEILIVVVILGILAAIVIPQFTSASETAKASSLTSQLQTIRSQLELYQVQHNGDYPALTATSWAPLTGTTDVTGAAATSGTTYGPYLQKPPGQRLREQQRHRAQLVGHARDPRRRQGAGSTTRRPEPSRPSSTSRRPTTPTSW